MICDIIEIRYSGRISGYTTTRLRHHRVILRVLIVLYKNDLVFNVGLHPHLFLSSFRLHNFLPELGNTSNVGTLQPLPATTSS